MYSWLVLLPLLFYSRLFNNPHSAILREDYFFPDSNSESTPEFTVFISFFFNFYNVYLFCIVAGF